MTTNKLMDFQGSFSSEKEAMEYASKIIGGGIVQKQGDEWVVFALVKD